MRPGDKKPPQSAPSPDPACPIPIKGNVNRKGQRIYFEPGDRCMSSEHFGQLAWQFKRVSGSSGLKVQAAIAC
jgi:hypothetical protein